MVNFTGKCLIGANNAMVSTYTAQQYPTMIRNFAVGVGNFAAGLALITIPYMWLLVSYLHVWLYARIILHIASVCPVAMEGVALHASKASARKMAVSSRIFINENINCHRVAKMLQEFMHFELALSLPEVPVQYFWKLRWIKAPKIGRIKFEIPEQNSKLATIQQEQVPNICVATNLVLNMLR